MNSFLTITEAAELTGKGRRTINRLANSLHKTGSDQVLREKTSRGYIWRISKQSLQDAYGVSESKSISSEAHGSSSLPVPADSESTLEIARQGYVVIMSMHQEVKQAYEALITEKDQRIAALNQELEQTRVRKGVWVRLFGN